MSSAPAPRPQRGEPTWIRGRFRCAVLGRQAAELRSGGRLHAVQLQDARAEAVVRIEPPPAEAEPGVLFLGRVEPLWICPEGQERWLRVAVAEARLLRPRQRIGRDDGDRSLLLLDGELVGRLVEAEEPFAGVTATAGSVVAAPAQISARSLPVSAGGIDWADAQVGSDAPPGCAPLATGCAVAPLGCLALPLALAGLLAALAGGAVLSVGLGTLGLLLLIAALRWLFGSRGWRWDGLRGWGLAGLGWLLGVAAALPPLLAFLQGDCPERRAIALVLLALAGVASAASEARFARAGVVGLGLLTLALFGFAEHGCSGGGLQKAQEWSTAALVRDDDAERAAKLQTGGGGRLSIDAALGQSWPPGSVCGRTIHFSGDLLFGHDEATLQRRAAPQLRKLAALLARQRATSDEALRLQIDGHADQSGEEPHNVRLSQRRAAAVRHWLVRHRALPADQISIVGHGSAEPLVPARPGADDDELRLNRRVEVVLHCAGAGFWASLPTAASAVSDDEGRP